MFIRLLSTTLPEICCAIHLNSNVIMKNSMDADELLSVNGLTSGRVSGSRSNTGTSRARLDSTATRSGGPSLANSIKRGLIEFPNPQPRDLARAAARHTCLLPATNQRMLLILSCIQQWRIQIELLSYAPNRNIVVVNLLTTCFCTKP